MDALCEGVLGDSRRVGGRGDGGTRVITGPE